MVRDYYSNGRRALGATLKPDLYRRFRLTEQQLGYLKFGDFLLRAAVGFVQVVMTLGGDTEVFPQTLLRRLPNRRCFLTHHLDRLCPPGLFRRRSRRAMMLRFAFASTFGTRSRASLRAGSTIRSAIRPLEFWQVSQTR